MCRMVSISESGDAQRALQSSDARCAVPSYASARTFRVLPADEKAIRHYRGRAGKLIERRLIERMHGELIERMARKHGTSRENIAYVISKWKRDVQTERRSRSQVAGKRRVQLAAESA